MKPVALPPGRARLSTKPAPTGSVTPAKHDRQSAADLLQRCDAQGAVGHFEPRFGVLFWLRRQPGALLDAPTPKRSRKGAYWSGRMLVGAPFTPLPLRLLSL